jgi:diguanylate cyclase (GGDEF)-like protein
MRSQETPSPLGQVRSTSLRTVVGAIGLVAALVVSLAGPISYATVTYLERAEILSFKASVNASKLAKYIFAHGRLWQYQRVRLAEIIELPESTGEPIRQRVVDANAKVVLEEGAKLSGPLLRRQAPIFIEGNAVGRIEVEESLTPFLITLALISLVSLVLGSGAYVAFRVLPLKVLDRTLGQLNVQNERFDAALNNMSEGLCMFDGQQRLLVSNARYAQMYGLQPDQVKPGITLREICAKRISHGVYAGEIPEEYAGKLLSLVAQKEPSTRLQELSDGRVIAIKYQPMPVGGWVATHEDITEQRRIQERIAYMAHHDGLTGLPNRVLLREGLEAALHSERDTHDLAVLCLDLDRFKEINDTLGHATGDALLGVIAERLRSCVRDTDIVARIGGDEFAIVQTGGEQPKDSTTLAARIIELTAGPVVINDQQMVVGTSIGIAIAPNDGTDTDQLLRNADLALYRAKTDGRGAYRFFEPEMDRRMQARRKLESDLRKALDNHEFELYYQPLVNLEHDEICGFEALLRWNHPERGKVMPAAFIPLTEETGLIVPIGKWVLQQACAEAAGWPDHFKVAVNVSAVQFMNPGLATTIISALTTSGLAPNRLEIEITESVMLQDADAALATLTQLHDLGVRIALDDFGTGYSSLSNLRKFPFDKIKIDRSFIADLSEANVDAIAVVRSVARLGASLGMATTAEGVETKDQLDLVRAEGCTEIQGYYFCRPSPASEIARLFMSASRKTVDAA